jgi:hypothetical protein
MGGISLEATPFAPTTSNQRRAVARWRGLLRVKDKLVCLYACKAKGDGCLYGGSAYKDINLKKSRASHSCMDKSRKAELAIPVWIVPALKASVTAL